MPQPHKIVLLGFSAFEKVTFESFFRLAARRTPGYILVGEARDAALAIVNADAAEVFQQCIAAKPSEKVLLVGAEDGGTGWPLLRRPLNLMKMLTTVEGLLTAPRASASAGRANDQKTDGSGSLDSQSALLASTFSPAPPGHSTAKPLDAAARNSVRTGVGKPRFEASSSGDPMANYALSQAPKPSGFDVEHILVVDDSDIALKFMRNRLSRFGFNADLVNSGEEALGRMNTRPYKFVFLEVTMEGLDGYQTCRAIKQRKYSDGKPPVVVMLTSLGGTIDKIRGALAGCDAYLTKPLNERDLIAVLAKHDMTVARGFQETSFGPSKDSVRGKLGARSKPTFTE